MFERARVDHNSQFATTARPVRVVLKNGNELRGRIVTRETHTTTTELNQDGQFIEFQPYDGDMRSLSKSSIHEVSETNVPDNDQLVRRTKGNGRFDPMDILGLPRGSSPEAIRAQYVKLAKTYHPDRFAALDMPDEIIEYVCAMQSRINTAYNELMPEAAAQAQSQAEAQERAQTQAAQKTAEQRQRPAPSFAVPKTRHPQAV